MLDFVVVEHAEAAPYECAATGDRTGPFIYTHREMTAGAVYISRSAVRRMALAFGLVKGGKKHEELLHADEVLREKDDENRELTGRNVQLTDSNALLVAENTDLKATILTREQRIAQLEGLLREDALATLQLVGS